HRDAAHGRLSVRHPCAQRRKGEGRSDHHDHLTLRREASSQSDRDRGQRLPQQALSGRPAGLRNRGAAWKIPMSGQLRELYSLLIPLQEERLLVPRMCVAEVIAFADTEREQRDPTQPEWFLGTVDWNGR